MSEHATELTREQLQRALKGFDDHGTMADYRHLHQLAEAARLLLAMKPASDEEVTQALVGSCDWPNDFDGGYRAAERRLLPFADTSDDAASSPSETALSDMGFAPWREGDE